MTVSKYLPPVLLHWSEAPFGDNDCPVVESFDGAVLIIDVSGFSDLTERLAQKGMSGAEQINNVLTRFFSDIADVIAAHGGTVFGYEGDAVIVGWRVTPIRKPDAPLIACCTCALEIQHAFSPRNVNGHEIDVRISVGVGQLDLIHLRFDNGRRHLLPTGQGIDEAERLSKEARPGEIQIAAQTALQIQSRFECLCRDENSYSLVAPIGAVVAFNEAPAEFMAKSESYPEAFDDYLLPLVRVRLNSALGNWMGELRKTTLLFVEVELKQVRNDVAVINSIAFEITGILEHQGGVVLSITLRHGRLLVEVAFGLPGNAGINDDWQAVATAVELQGWARGGGFRICAGVASGRVFCGPFGAPHFREYTVVGSAANRAARLRDVATGRILVDEETQKTCERSIGFDGPWSLRLAGIRGPVNAYVPTEQVAHQPGPVGLKMIGRTKEKKILNDMLVDCQHRVQVAMIYGEGGIGKSTLVASLLAEFTDAERISVSGMTDALDVQTPYVAWREILRQFLGLSSPAALNDDALANLKSNLEAAIGDITFAPLLNDIIDLNLPESRITASMPSNVRAENLRKLVLKLVLHHLNHTTRVLVIEDAHWIDSSSRVLLVEIIRCAPRALIVITSRLSETMAEEMADLVAEGHSVRKIPLGRLQKSNVITMARRALGESEVSASLQNFIVQTSDGVPLFVEELCHLAKSLGQSGTSKVIELPNILETTILGRIDTLSPEDQLVLKTASVIGFRFERHFISQLAPIRDSHIDIEAAVARIVGLRLCKFDETRPNDLEFRHQIIRDLVYDGLLSQQKAETHAVVARQMEVHTNVEDIETLPLLLNHWRCAGDAAKLVIYLERLAASRLRQFDNASTISLLEEFFGRVKELEVPDDTMRDARCFLMLGNAHLGLGKMVEAEAAFEKGLAMLGMRLPSSRVAVALELGKQVIGQTRRRWRSDKFEIPQLADGNRRFCLRLQRAEMAAEAHQMLIHIFYFNGQKAKLLNSALSAANLSADLGVASASLAINTAALGAICGVIPLRKQAAYYLQRASKVADFIDEPSASGRVCLYSGLYETAVADWDRAGRSFLDGMEKADATGDRRLWCEHAVSFELICSPWSLTYAFQDIDAWDALLSRLEEISLEREDMQVYACANLGRLRGNKSIGRKVDDIETRAKLEQLMDPAASPKLELIHYAEGAGLLASAAFEASQGDNGEAWMDLARQRMGDLEPGMKSRTLPALRAVFDACLCQLKYGKPDDRAATIDLASLVTSKMQSFARIYPIGRPYLFLCKGDLALLRGRPKAAERYWRSGFSESMKLKMRAATAISMQRLQSIRDFSGERISDDPTLLHNLDRDTPAARDVFHKIHSCAFGNTATLENIIKEEAYPRHNI